MDAIAVVTTPETTVAGSPALMVSNVSGFHSTPMLFLMRSMTSVAEMGGLVVRRLVSANGAAMAETVRAPNSRRDREGMPPWSARDFLGVAIDGTVYSRCGVGHEWVTNGFQIGSRARCQSQSHSPLFSLAGGSNPAPATNFSWRRP